MRRYVSRARGRALRTLGVPNLPNLPSGRALAQNELRNAIRRPDSGRQARVAGRQQPADVPPTGSGPVRPSPTSNPYDDPSRDVGDGPDALTRPQAVMVLIAVVIFIYLLTSTSEPPPPGSTNRDHCHITCEEAP